MLATAGRSLRLTLQSASIRVPGAIPDGISPIGSGLPCFGLLGAIRSGWVANRGRLPWRVDRSAAGIVGVTIHPRPGGRYWRGPSERVRSIRHYARPEGLTVA